MKMRKSRFDATQIIVLGFIAVIFAGTFLLMLPISSVSRQPTNFIDSLFTATSATCVTGLTVVETGVHWSFFGKFVILLLIQTGGPWIYVCGIIVFACGKTPHNSA